MTKLDKIKELTPKLILTVLSNINRIETIITEIISVDFCNQAHNIYKRVEFFNYFEDNLTLQPKIDLLKIILENNHPDILKMFPNYFNDLEEVKQVRNKIAHNEIQYEWDSTFDTTASLILHHPRIKRQKKLNEKRMLEIIEKTEKVSADTRTIWVLIGKTKNLRFG